MEWSPFYVLPKAELTPSGLLKLDTSDHEVELLRRSPVEIRHEGTDEPMAPRPKTDCTGEWTSRSTNLTVILTTHRIVWSDNNNDHRFLHLSNVHVVRATGGPSFQHPRATWKIAMSTYTYADIVIVFRTGNSNNSICQKDRDTTFEQLETSLKRKLWEHAQRLQEKTANQNAAARRRVGVDHILQRQKLQQQQAQQLADTAFKGDSDQLLEQAGELLQVIRKSKALLDRMGEGNGGGNDIASGDVEAAERLSGLLSDMGMTSALTKSQVIGDGGRNRRYASSSSGGGGGGGGDGGGGFKLGGSSSSTGVMNMTSSQRQYYELTARQLADFLIPRLKSDNSSSSINIYQSTHKTTKSATSSSSASSGRNEYGRGIMTLTDVYCLFNRARGTNLISPEDLRHACSILGELDIGLSQRTFPSGVIVVQLDDMSLDASNPDGAKRLADLCQPSTTALEASHYLNVSPLLAMEQLEEAERLGILCRDTMLETVRFFKNKFVEWA